MGAIVKYNRKLIMLSVVLLVISAIAFYFFWDDTKNVIRIILESNFTSFILFIVTVLICLVHYFSHKNKEVLSEPIITKKFGSFVDNALGGVAYGTAITTSLTLLKGLYVQKFFTDKIYFIEFQDLDLITIAGVAFFLLYYCCVKVIDIAKETYKVEHTEKVLNEKGEPVIPNNENISTDISIDELTKKDNNNKIL